MTAKIDLRALDFKGEILKIAQIPIQVLKSIQKTSCQPKKWYFCFFIFKIDKNRAISILFSFRALDFTGEILKNCSNSNLSAKIYSDD